MSKSAVVKTKATVVVVGGGFSGLLVCRHMAKHYKVILVDAKEYFEYYPGILRAYVEPAEHKKLIAPYQAACATMGCEFLWGECMGINEAKREVNVMPIYAQETMPVPFDYLVLSNGCAYGIPTLHHERSAESAKETLWYPTFLKGDQENSKWSKVADERFIQGRERHVELEYQELKKINAKKGAVMVVGAGFTGVEWATELKHYFPDLEVILVEQRADPLEVMPKSCRDYARKSMENMGIHQEYNFEYKSYLDTAAKMAWKEPSPEVDKEAPKPVIEAIVPGIMRRGDSMWIEKGKQAPERIFMCVGFWANHAFMPEGVAEPQKGSRGGWIHTNKQLQVIHMSEEKRPFCEGRVFACGNCCTVEGVMVPKNSFPGEEMAAVLCKNITKHEKEQPLMDMYYPWGSGMCATSLGPNNAVFVMNNKEKGSGFTMLKGRLAAWQKEFIRWSKVDQCRGGLIGKLVWALVH